MSAYTHMMIANVAHVISIDDDGPGTSSEQCGVRCLTCNLPIPLPWEAVDLESVLDAAKRMHEPA